MRASRYNIASQPLNGERALFNTATGNLAFVTNREYENILSGIVSDPEFVKLGYIVPDHLDEIKVAIDRRASVRARPRRALSVTIVPTLRCNFSCGYCYNGVNHKSGDAGASFKGAFKYIKNELASGEPLHVTWYGGEPTLQLDEILSQSVDLKELCSARGSHFSCDLLTNGSTLNEKQCAKLVELPLTDIQVSIDWPIEKSERQKGRLSAHATLDDVLKRTALIPQSIPLVYRINVMPGFLATFDRLLTQMKASVGRPHWAYIHRLFPSNDPSLNSEASGEMRFPDIVEFYREYAAARKILRDFGYSQEFFPQEPDTGYCIAQNSRDIIFDGAGDAKKCVREIEGPAARIDLDTGHYNDRGAAYMNSEVTSSDGCYKCTFMPLCHSGCPKDKYEHPSAVLERCTPWKFILPNELTSFLQINLTQNEG
ncbi:MAG TPA: radical SAM protein [Rhizobiaceae bacterium]|nr:radical SAM protein [Rhizobiaceae bacterium]